MLRIFFALSLSVLLISCDKDDESTPEVEVENFFALTVGNTYSYSYHVRVSDTEEFETLSLNSDVEITDEVTIEGESFFEFTTTTTGEDSFPSVQKGVIVTTVRDVDGVLQNQTGELLFSNVDGSDPYLISENEWGDVFVTLLDQTQQKSVPAGNFECSVNRLFAILPSNDESAGQDLTFYADGVGEIFKTHSSVSNPQHIWEKRLVSFELAD